MKRLKPRQVRTAARDQFAPLLLAGGSLLVLVLIILRTSGSEGL